MEAARDRLGSRAASLRLADSMHRGTASPPRHSGTRSTGIRAREPGDGLVRSQAARPGRLTERRGAAGNPAGVLGVGGVEQPPRLLRADEHRRSSARAGRRPAPTRSSAVLTFSSLASTTPATLEPGPTGVGEPVHGDHRVARRGAEVEHDVGVVDETRPRGPGSAASAARRRDRDHRQPALARPARDLDRDGGQRRRG